MRDARKPAFGAWLAMIVATGASAGDMLPLKRGVFVPAGRACRGAANAEIVDYRGGAHSLGDPHTLCTIKTLHRRGKAYMLSDTCSDFGSGAPVPGGTTTLIIASPIHFRKGAIRYRYCGGLPQP